MVDLTSAADISQGVRSGAVTAGQVAEAALARIRKADGVLRAFITVDRERVLSRAEAIDRLQPGERAKLPLAGVPVAVKDNICTRGLRTTCGSRILGNYIPPYDATAVARLEMAGAVVVGKANCDEFAMGSSTENSAFAVTRNPFDLGRVPGGSSGGSAVAVAAGMCPLALGSETGGSVRQPASFCGILGLKPTYGRVSRYGLVAFASSLDAIGQMARSARDLALLLQAVAGHDPHDMTSSREPAGDYSGALSGAVRGLKLGIPREYFGAGLDPGVKSAVESALAQLEKLGCELAPVSLPHTDYAIADYYIIAPAEASSNLARYDGVRYGYRAEGAGELDDMYRRSREEGFGPEVKRRIMLGTYALSSGYYEAYYGRALKVRTLIRQDFQRAFAEVDGLLAPVSPTPAFRIGEKADDPLAMYLSDIYTVTANLAGIPALSVPCGFTSGGLPVGLQVLGPHFREDLLLNIAAAYEQTFPLTPPPLKV